MADFHVENLITTVSAVASAGVGAFTISTASSGAQTFGASHDGKTFSIRVTEGTKWETAVGCTYTHAGTSLARGTRTGSSNAGAAETFTSAAIVTVTPSADLGNRLEALLQGVTPGGRLTLESGVPVSTTDQTGKTSVFYTPFVSNMIVLWDSTAGRWVPVTFTEQTLALGTVTSGLPYDVFGFLSGGALSLEKLAWTNGTTRATAVTLQDGRYCKSGDKTRLLLGTIYTTSTTATEDSLANRYVANVYNQVLRAQYACPAYNDNNAVTSYSETSTVWTPANGGTGSTIRQVLAIPGVVMVGLNCIGDPGSGQGFAAGIGIDSTTTATYEVTGIVNVRLIAAAAGPVVFAAGQHFESLLLSVTGGTATVYADDARKGGASDPRLTQVTAQVMS